MWWGIIDLRVSSLILHSKTASYLPDACVKKPEMMSDFFCMPMYIRVHKKWREWHDGVQHSSKLQMMCEWSYCLHRGYWGVQVDTRPQWVNLPGLPRAPTQSFPDPAEPLGRRWPGTHVIVLWPSTTGARKGVAFGRTLENTGFVQQPKFITSDRFHAGAATNLTACDKQPDRFVLLVFYRLLTNRAVREVMLWHFYP